MRLPSRIIAMDAKNANSLAIILRSHCSWSLLGISMQPNFGTRFCCAVFLVAVQLAGAVTAQSKLTIDCSKPDGTFRALHGVNGGVLNRGETIDLTERWRELGVPLARLHDCEWPTGEIVDMHSVFPNIQADALQPASYQFARTDDYLRAIVGSSAKIVYRLGENIEHSPRKHFVHPPADYDLWAAACLGIIRHYNEGWADGFQHDIQYWEIWNEPENRPVMWSGTDEEYFRLYATAAKAIKSKWPVLKVGGPAVGATGEVIDGRLKPTEFLTGFLRYCRMHDVPLDFFSWHTYTDDPALYVAKGKAIRRWLNGQGFEITESHLNEWNYLPSNDWQPVLSKDASARRAWYERQGGPEGAAFLAAVLVEMQDAPIDAANYFSGDTGEFGLFDRYGGPKKTFYAMKAFRMLLGTPRRLKEHGQVPNGITVAAGATETGKEVRILLSNRRPQAAQIELQLHNISGEMQRSASRYLLDAGHDLGKANGGVAISDEGLKIDCPAHSVTVLTFADR
jgi:xylan 1,4-beta-xylosidase